MIQLLNIKRYYLNENKKNMIEIKYQKDNINYCLHLEIKNNKYYQRGEHLTKKDLINFLNYKIFKQIELAKETPLF